MIALTLGSLFSVVGFFAAIGHAASFDSQSGVVYNRYVAAWFAGCLTFASVNLLVTTTKPS